ncbi:MAG TPA: hypothetical protein ENH82_06115 [bacterium]|nr:hypothetical protein [bacterium]
MGTYAVQTVIDGQPTFEKPLDEILADLKMGGALRTLTPLEYITLQQIKWIKGVLLPALAADTGDSVAVWEARLKRNVMPEDFPPTVVQDGPYVNVSLPSITTLGKKKMGQFIEGSVAHLRDEKIYGDKFLWVCLPDKELRKM